ncbi:hypothetical protein NNC58_08170 [Prevotella copri]|jgi:hypothetical protein|uniref:Uncharacterized protein n=1 Tax=Segatella copri TaxID=165179 RepID=A0AAW5IHA3_9BACT|nr:hypothetical protein [Segatella copri]MCP9534817.1 hypothetical protein [Segatella copri]MCP9537670.1 hypothetical protein [Segatella copri]MCP9540667.1 hypothetical protein [Segatella copri]MCP9558829.1 hypothetical protein [Segatella copri]MCP9561553.1 hypothetical protein [Segatella copri]
MNIYNNHNYGDNYTLQAGATVVARSGLEEALARERIYDELERQAEQQGMTLEEWLAMQKHRNQHKDQHQDLYMDRNRHQESAAETWLQKSKEERIRIAFEQMKTEKCQGRTANYFGRRVGYQYAFILALMRAKDERYGLPYVETTNEFLTYLKEYVGVKDLPSEDTIGRRLTRISGRYPDWRIEDGNQMDILEAQHVAQRFLSIYMKGV